MVRFHGCPPIMGPTFSSLIYQKIAKPVLFQFDPENVHSLITHLAEETGKYDLFKKFFSNFYGKRYSNLKQNIVGIDFESPIGLAAGFDYEARLTQILASFGFGFQTVGTITNNSYAGNPPPRLGRLPKSQSLMVYKGFKNDGARKVSEKLSSLSFPIPLGISVGKTNTANLKTQKEAVSDVISAFETFERSKVKNLYYELNISCPNLFGNVTFYPPRNLDELLSEVDKLKIKRPIFIKMPIEKTDKESLAMLDVISKYKITGVILGNLQTNRSDPALDPTEVAKFKDGNFSGKPTQKRSDELIKLAFKNYKGKLVIVGCGGVFNAKDAYRKIKLGATLVQLITGLIYKGPFVVSEINKELSEFVKKDGFKNIADAVGKES